MKTILVPTQNIATMTPALETALLLAQRTGAYIEGFPLRFGLPQYVVAELAIGFSMEAYQAKNEEDMVEIRHLFETFMRQHGIAHARTASSRPCFGWLDTAPEGEDFVGSYGRAFDVTVLSRSDPETASFQNRVIESTLFESGRPILLCPSQAPRTIATNVMIHWNGSTEQARANAFAEPLLHLAEKVTVLTVIGGQEVPGPSVDHILRQLTYNGIAAKPMSIGLDGRSTGEAILDAARIQGCDLLVKGAYTRNRLRQMIFGGATSYIIEHADLPVLMAH